jgi:hypothetical protein
MMRSSRGARKGFSCSVVVDRCGALVYGARCDGEIRHDVCYNVPVVHSKEGSKGALHFMTL